MVAAAIITGVVSAAAATASIVEANKAAAAQQQQLEQQSLVVKTQAAQAGINRDQRISQVLSAQQALASSRGVSPTSATLQDLGDVSVNQAAADTRTANLDETSRLNTISQNINNSKEAAMFADISGGLKIVGSAARAAEDVSNIEAGQSALTSLTQQAQTPQLPTPSDLPSGLGEETQQFNSYREMLEFQQAGGFGFPRDYR